MCCDISGTWEYDTLEFSIKFVFVLVNGLKT
jgi:hypothetical protein